MYGLSANKLDRWLKDKPKAIFFAQWQNKPSGQREIIGKPYGISIEEQTLERSIKQIGLETESIFEQARIQGHSWMKECRQCLAPQYISINWKFGTREKTRQELHATVQYCDCKEL